MAVVDDAHEVTDKMRFFGLAIASHGVFDAEVYETGQFAVDVGLVVG